MSIIKCAHCEVAIDLDSDCDDIFTVQYWNKTESYCGWCAGAVLTQYEYKSYLSGQKEFNHQNLYKTG